MLGELLPLYDELPYPVSVVLFAMLKPGAAAYGGVAEFEAR